MEASDKTTAISTLLRANRSKLAAGDLAAPTVFRALLSELSVPELQLLWDSPLLVQELVRITCLRLPALQAEVEKKLSLKVDGWQSYPGAEEEENFYISTTGMDKVRPSWVRNKTFSVGYYAETKEELAGILRTLLTSRVRLSLWHKIIAKKISAGKQKKEKKPEILDFDGAGFFV